MRGSRTTAVRPSPGCTRPRTYDLGMPEPWLIALVLVMIGIAAIPTRRLAATGLTSGWLLSYLAFLVIFGLLVATGRGPERVLVPVLVVAFVAPFIAAPEVLGRLLRRVRPAEPGSSGQARPPGRRSGGRRGEPRIVGSGRGRTVRPDGTVEPPGEPGAGPDGGTPGDEAPAGSATRDEPTGRRR